MSDDDEAWRAPKRGGYQPDAPEGFVQPPPPTSRGPVRRADLTAERERLMTEQERLLRAGVPIEDLARLVDVGDQSMTGDAAPKVTTPPATRMTYATRQWDPNDGPHWAWWVFRQLCRPFEWIDGRLDFIWPRRP